MKKYLSVFEISYQQEFAYRLNFIMWRFRNIIQVFITFFMWTSIFAGSNKIIFGYSKERIFTYVLGILMVRAFVMSSRSADVSGDISRGEITNYLLKPINYFGFWLTRDLSSKVLNMIFALVETIILFLILKPVFFVQTNPMLVFAFLVSLAIAFFIYFNLLFLTNSVPFWYPEVAWGAQFLFMVVIAEFLSGSLFPIDVLPAVAQDILMLTPFPYLIYFPLQVYLGKLSTAMMLKGIVISGAWLVLLGFCLNKIWKRGLKAYTAHGR